jgi:hypothetical protein
MGNNTRKRDVGMVNMFFKIKNDKKVWIRNRNGLYDVNELRHPLQLSAYKLAQPFPSVTSVLPVFSTIAAATGR